MVHNACSSLKGRTTLTKVKAAAANNGAEEMKVGDRSARTQGERQTQAIAEVSSHNHALAL